MKRVFRVWLLTLPLWLLSPVFAQNDFEIAKNVNIFVSILKDLNEKYADEISPGALTQTAIDAMLKSLDPYTVYYPESQIEDYRMMTTGQYGGVGALIQQHGKDVVISEPYEGSPSAKAGLWAGDIIRKVNGQNLDGKNSSDVSAAMKGQPGSTLVLEVFRPSANKTLTFNIIREEIKLPNIPYSGIIGDNVGYIKLDQFTEKAGSEVLEAFQKLKEQGMKYLVLDLRNNGGGLLGEAVRIMNIFVEQGVKIVETKGKIPEMQKVYKTPAPATDKDIPVVVLVNDYSASASEIVSGAFQDLDRGVIVGKKTFGKGLVQNVLPLDYNTSLKITVAKYYIPSGRCVQNIEYFEKDTSKGAFKIPDSLAVAFKTKNGRTVYDKGGVEPDVLTKDSLVSEILASLITHNLVFDFANEYRAKHETIPPADQFRVDDNLYAEFVEFLKDKDYSYKTEAEEALEDFKKTAEETKSFKSVEPIYNQLKEKLEQAKAQDLQTYKKEICSYLASEIAVRYYYQKGRIMNILSDDPDITVAKSILLDNARYRSILSPKK
ncbi:MAG: S41 family peptidase [Bacteroidales bacterium]|nr:S41 family peptidase [Bacteroidales bacterium]MBR6161809.1 S41 family peptidase [Bacteroidales bacterium]